jgi:hypothetical protein
MTPSLSHAAAVARMRHDRQLLIDAVNGHSEAELRADFRVDAGPLGDFCESLHDLVAHVLTWDEINLAVLAEATRGRRHWSLDPRWETPEAGRALNRAGVIGGRAIPSELLVHRYREASDALLAELDEMDGPRWEDWVPFDPSRTIGSLVEYAMTVPRQPPYWHAAIHLGAVPEEGAV